MDSPIFTLVSSNQEKIYFARLALKPRNISFNIHPVSVPELQSNNPYELISHKALGAYSILQKPVVVIDHWWSIPAVGGFPGPYMRFVNDHMQAEDILRLMHGITNRQITLTECICYKDNKVSKTFFEKTEGTVLLEKRGQGLPGQQIISLTNDNVSIAEHLNNKTDPRGKNKHEIWANLVEWLKNKS